MSTRDCARCPNRGTCPLSRLTGGVVEPLESREMLAANPIVAENQLPGTPESAWEVTDAGDPTIQGFATDISVNVGQTVSFKVDDVTLAKYHIDIYRMGYYQGNGARLVTTIPASQVLRQDQPDPIKDNQTGLIDCGNWAVSASWAVPSNAVSGIYIANLVREDTGGKSSVYFIVRNDASQSDLLFQTSDTTWEAYNSYGGNSLYVGSSAATAGQPVSRAVAVSYNRPLVVQGKYGGLDSFNGPLHAEYPMVRWLEANGYDVTYFTGVDADRRGGLIKNHEAYLSVGHDEYWSGGQRANVEAARGAGVNLAFFSGNELYWKVRWEESVDASGTPYRTMVCYKETHAQAKTDPEPGVWTGQWRDPRFGPHDGGVPENELTGQMFSVNADTTDLGSAIQVPAAFAKMRLWRDTSVANLTGTQVATLNAKTLGYEWDEDVDNGFRPAGMFQLSSTTRTVPQKLIDFYSGYGAPCPGCVGMQGACGCTVGQDTATHSLTLYKDESGALVFGAGTVQWSWGLDGHHIDGASTPDVRMQQATVNLFADMHAQPGSLQGGLKAQSASTDATAPTARITSPAAGTSAPIGEDLTITGTAADAGGGVVAGVEVSTDGGRTWHPASGRTSWSYTWDPGVGGAATILARAVDDSGNLQADPASVNVTTPGPTDQTMFGAKTPFITSQADLASVEVGTKFRADVDGQVTGVRFFKGEGNTGTHVGNLWTGTGQLLATVTFTNETADGWQYALFSSPVSITADTTYVVSYFAPGGHYADDQWYFDIGRDDGGGQVHALANGVDGGNGVYRYGASSAFPTRSDLADNYYVDVLFRPSGADTTPPVVTARSPAAGAVGVPTMSSVAATFSEPVQSGSIAFTLKAAGGAGVLGTTTYDAAGRTATFTPGAALSGGITYTASVVATDLAGNAMSPATWSFTTASQGGGAQTIFGTSVPIVSSDADAVPIELGVKFETDVDGTISGVRFYKGAGNTGIHTGSIWSLGGTRLATATFFNETEIGWQTLTFDSPVAVTAGTVLVASYFAPNGHYAADDNYFKTQGAGDGLVHALANGASGPNGVYRYSSTSVFPSSGYLSTNYWVDVVFNPASQADTDPPTVTGTSPAAGASGVATTDVVAATFSESVTAGSVAFTVKDSAGATVPGTVAYDDATRTATFTPSAALVAGATYTASVSAADLAGNAMAAPYPWSFTTAAGAAPISIWDETDVPAVVADPDAGPIEVGVKFRSDVAGFITGLRFYKAATNTGVHVGHLWSADGTLLAEATFVDETASGWQTVRFDRPVAIQAGVTYVASYHTDVGHYSVTENDFGPGGEDNGPLHALRSGVDGGNGVYSYGPGAFPMQTYRASNYWVDVLFEPA